MLFKDTMTFVKKMSRILVYDQTSCSKMLQTTDGISREIAIVYLFYFEIEYIYGFYKIRVIFFHCR